MCGIAGFIDTNITYDVAEVVKNICNSIEHRGPDSYGWWTDQNRNINLIHRRLAILDLSEAGHQPMISFSGRYVMIFNGEIYNFQRIKSDLECKFGNINWKGHSDSEVILYAMDVYGIESTVDILEGMFAIAVWDREESCLTLIRDRIGEKPLYYGYANGSFLFASELKAICQHPKFEKNVSREAIGQYLIHSCVPSPLSIYNGIFKLNAGHMLKLSMNDFHQLRAPDSYAYWKLSVNDIKNSCSQNLQDTVNICDDLLSGVVLDQMRSDVSLGCFLSGGIDSSLIASLMQKNSNTKINSFSIGFTDSKYNEAHYAKEVASYLGTNHTEVYLSDNDCLDVVANLADIYDEPFCDSSQIPTVLVCKMARQRLKVVLSGDGGDEVFAGYGSYIKTHKVSSTIDKFPNYTQGVFSGIIGLVNKAVKNHQLDRLKMLISKEYFSYYMTLMSDFTSYKHLVSGGLDLTTSLWHINKGDESLISYLQKLDISGYLSDDILVKVDRAAMFSSLETRAPFLNHRVIEFASRIPEQYKFANGKGKILLREVLYKYVPQSLIDRPKHGFGIPLDNWLRGQFKELINIYLSDELLNKYGYFNTENVRMLVNEHMSNRANHGLVLWKIFILQQWLEKWS